MRRLLDCCIRSSRKEVVLDESNSDGDTKDLAKATLATQQNESSRAKVLYTDEPLYNQVSLAHVQRVVSTIAGGCEEAWLYRIDAALAVILEQFDAESVSLHTVYDGSLAFAALSACGIGAEDLPRGLPHSLTQDLSSSVAVLLTSQVRCGCTGAAIRASAPPADPASAAASASAAALPGNLDSLPPDWQRLHRRHGLRHFICVPLFGGELIVGALTLASRQGSLPPACWHPDALGLVAATLSLLLQPRQLAITTSIMTEIHLARNIDELVRAVRRGVFDLVVSTTHLPPVLRLALIRSDGSAAAVFEEAAQRRSSFIRLSVCSEAAGPTGGVPEMLQPLPSRRSMDASVAAAVAAAAVGGRISANQLIGQLTRDRLTGNNPTCDVQQMSPTIMMVMGRPPAPPSMYGGGGGRPKSCILGAEGAAPVAVAVASSTGASDPLMMDRGCAPVALHERLMAAAAGGGGGGTVAGAAMGLGLANGSSFSTGHGNTAQAGNGNGNGNHQAANASSNKGGGGARGHSLSLANTLLGESLQKECGLWISDCTLYLQEARTYPRDIVFSRGSRAVHSIAVCGGRHNGAPLLGAYCVYGAVLPRQLLRAVTLELEQLLKLLSPSVHARLCSPALMDEWLYLHEELLNPAKVDPTRRQPRVSASVAPDLAVMTNAAAMEGYRYPGSPPLQTAGQQPAAAAAATAGSGGGSRLSPSSAAVVISVAARSANEPLYERGTSVTGAPRQATGGDGVGVVGGAAVPSSALLSTATRFSDQMEVESPLPGSLSAQALQDTHHHHHHHHHSPSQPGQPGPGPGAGPGLAGGGLASVGFRAVAPALLTSLRALGLATKSTSGASRDIVLPPSLGDGVAQPPTPPSPAAAACGGAGSLEDDRAAAGSRPSTMAVAAAVAAAALRPSSTGSAGGAGAVAFVTSLLDSPGQVQDVPTRVGAPAFGPPGDVFGGGGLGSRTAGSMIRMMLAAPSFTVESVRSTALGGGLRRAPLVSGLHERLAAAQASRLVHGSAIEHQEELAAIEVLEKIGAGGYGEVYRGQYDGMEVAIKIVYEPHGNTNNNTNNTTTNNNTNPSATFFRVGRPTLAPAAGTATDEDATAAACGSGGRDGGGGGGGGAVTAAGCTTAPLARSLHDAFELTVSVSVTHPNIVQVLTFFTDVYVHVDRRGGSNEQLPSTPVWRMPPSPLQPSPQQHQHHQQQLHQLHQQQQQQQQPSPHHHHHQQHQQQAGQELGAGDGAAAGGGGGGGGGGSPAVGVGGGRGPLRPPQSGGGAAASGGGSTPLAARVTLLPYPSNQVTSCQLNTVDVSGVHLADYTALQAAMASNGSSAQQAVAGSPPAMVICMEYCDAGSLVDAIVRGAFRQPALGLYGFTQPNMKAIFATLLEVALALRHLHSLRLVHCDLKPSNILLRYSGRDPRGFTAKLSDFGLVRLMEPCGEGGRLAIPKGVTHGTVTHMAPEVLGDKGLPHDASLDIYAFGITMWQIVYGGRLYPGVSHSDIPGRVVREGMRPRFISNVPSEYRRLAESCWAANPDSRPTAAALVLTLKELMGLGPRLKGQRRYSALAPQRQMHSVMETPPATSSSGAAAAPFSRAGARASPGACSYLGRGASFFGGAEYHAGDGGAMAAAGLPFPLAAGYGVSAGGAAALAADEADGGAADGGGGGGGGGRAAGDVKSGAMRSKSGGMRTRSLSYSGFPVHIL